MDSVRSVQIIELSVAKGECYPFWSYWNPSVWSDRLVQCLSCLESVQVFLFSAQFRMHAPLREHHLNSEDSFYWNWKSTMSELL